MSRKRVSFGPPKRFARQLNIRLTAEMIRRLTSAVKRDPELTASQVVRIALRNYLEELESKRAA